MSWKNNLLNLDNGWYIPFCSDLFFMLMGVMNIVNGVFLTTKGEMEVANSPVYELIADLFDVDKFGFLFILCGFIFILDIFIDDYKYSQESISFTNTRLILLIFASFASFALWILYAIINKEVGMSQIAPLRFSILALSSFAIMLIEVIELWRINLQMKHRTR